MENTGRLWIQDVKTSCAVFFSEWITPCWSAVEPYEFCFLRSYSLCVLARHHLLWGTGILSALGCPCDLVEGETVRTPILHTGQRCEIQELNSHEIFHCWMSCNLMSDQFKITCFNSVQQIQCFSSSGTNRNWNLSFWANLLWNLLGTVFSFEKSLWWTTAI